MADDPVLAPLKPPEAKALARDIAENGIVEFSGHALDEMKKDDLETTDCLNIWYGQVCTSRRNSKRGSGGTEYGQRECAS